MAVSTELVDELLKSLNLLNIKGGDLLTRLQDELDELKKEKTLKLTCFNIHSRYEVQRNLAEEDDDVVVDAQPPCKHFTGLAHILWWTLSALRKNETINRTFDGYDDFLCLSDGLV